MSELSGEGSTGGEELRVEVVVRAKKVFLRDVGFRAVGSCLGECWLLVVSETFPMGSSGMKLYP